MAEPTLAAASTTTVATDVKQEHEPHPLEGLDFTLPPELAAKRPLEQVDSTTEGSEAKRAKIETETETEEASLEDGLALLVQNALSNVGDLVDHFGDAHDVSAVPAPDPMELDATIPLHEAELETIPGPPPPRPTFAVDPQRYIRDANIHALGNLALSILLILVQPPFEDTIKLVRGADSDHRRSFRKLQTSFEHVRDMYSPTPVLSASQLDIRDSDPQTFIELANLAQLGIWLVDGTPKALSEADENFLSMFQCQLSDLPTGMTELYLEIKTQRAIEFLVEKEPEKPSDEVIGEVLTHGLVNALKEQHGGEELTSADQTFVSVVETTKEKLQGEVKKQPEPAALRDKHPAEDLLRSYLTYATGRLTSLTDLGNRLGVPILLSEVEHQPEQPDPTLEANGDADLDLDDLSSFFEKTASGLVQNALAGLTEEAAAAAAQSIEGGESSAQGANAENKPATSSTHPNGKVDLITDYKELEALVAESTSNYVKTTLHGLSPVPYQPTVPTSTTESMAAQLPYLTQLQNHQAQHPYYTTYTQPPPEPQQPPAPGEHLPPNQTFPSAILYDKARQAALSKSSAHTRREGLHSTRRPWTQEEEKALMAGLDMVKGPHWSQILTLFGQNGTISDILKDRTQVQLKDKARNLKLFFLKTNSEMPYYLQAVTGELKTRAPTQAARKEAEERARLNSEEDQAKLQGILALAGGLQHPPHGRTSASPASSVVTPAQAAQAAASSSTQHQHPARPNHAASQAGHPSIPRPMATPASQMRPGVQTNAQQVLHSVAQAHQRPQAQLPPQVPRPQGQAQPQPHRQQQPALPQQQQSQPATAQSSTAQQPATNGLAVPTPQPPNQQQQQHQGSPAQQSPATSVATSTPVPTTSTPAQGTAMPTLAQTQPAASTPATSTPQPTQPTPSPAPHQPVQASHISHHQESSKPEEITAEQDDNAAEAALLEGLQGLVAQSLSS